MKNRSLQGSFRLPLRCIKKAFSLVEILVALIIVSVIMAALAPVITKKLKSAGITIVGGGSGGAEPKREIDCTGSNFIQIGDLCVTKRNMGDNGNTTLSIPLAASVASVSAGANCNATTGKCCWIGNTTYACDEVNGGYSGCNRTVCNYEAAKAICESFTYGGKTWRLPTPSELAQFGAHSIGKGADGLQLCDLNADANSAQCSMGAGKCPGTTGNNCHAHRLWSNLLSDNTVKGSGLVSGSMVPNDDPKTNAFSVRCVVDNPWIGGTTTVTPSTPSTPAPDCSDGTGLGCPSGYRQLGNECRSILEYEFNGDHHEDDSDSSKLKIYLTGNGVFTAKSDGYAEIFIVGGGGGGGACPDCNAGGGGGGFYHIATHNFKKGEQFRVLIGAGGGTGAAGGTTYFGSMTAAGGKGAKTSTGGIGGPDGVASDGGNGGAAGNDGIQYDGEWFAGGGGGAKNFLGGLGGGGKGVGDTNGIAGEPNTGGGGGGMYDDDHNAGAGGSGVVVIKVPRDRTTPLICTKALAERDVCAAGQVKECPDGYELDGYRCVTKLQYTYTGSSYVAEKDKDIKQKIYLTGNGVFTAESAGTATVFLVGGGGGGGACSDCNAGGGGGGFTTTATVNFKKGDKFRVLIGTGGGTGATGGTTVFGTMSAAGGKGAKTSTGGSGGSDGVNGDGGNGGQPGYDGVVFDDEWFSGGGGGASSSPGGLGGGGKGVGDTNGIAGEPNTGGGGGGMWDDDHSAGAGGSGVVVLKIDRERINPICKTPTPIVAPSANTIPTCESGYTLSSSVLTAGNCITDFKYNYTGQAYAKETNDAYKIYLTGSGIFTAESAGTATAFLVGGGGGGGACSDCDAGGGGGGFTTTATIRFKRGDRFRVIIGAGGGTGAAGAATYFGTMSAAGGKGARTSTGGAGGEDGVAGDGGNAGQPGYDGVVFDDEWFSGGGGGASSSPGGLGGGGKGVGDTDGIAGEPNTGGGGGGMWDNDHSAGAGGSGVVVLKFEKDVIPPIYLTEEEIAARREEEKSKIVYNTCLSGFNYHYDGAHYEVKTDYDYKIYLLGSGTLTTYNPGHATAFLVGGGGGGGGCSDCDGGGGGGGFTTTADVVFAKNGEYSVTIGAGGSGGTTNGSRGGTTKFDTINAEGGYGASRDIGGSGGADGNIGDGGNGGAAGHDGVEFESEVFAGGGGGGRSATGGLGGGAKGVGDSNGIAADPNTGGGGGGMWDDDHTAGKGASGIVVISLKDCAEGDSGSGYLSGGVGLTTGCSNVVNANCRLCSRSNGQCYSCALSCPHGYTKDTATCTCIDAYPNQPKSQTDCDQWNSLFIPAGKIDNDRNLCITKWNAGDSDSGYSASPKGATIPSGVNVVNAGTNCNTSTTACCFKGATASPCETSLASSYAGMSTYYSGCNRTVCNYSAAKLICENYAPSGTNIGDWRLPTSGELQNIGHIINTKSFETNVHEIIQRYSGAMGLQFCDWVTGYGSIMCSYGATGNCPGAPDSQCLSGHLHASNRQRYYLAKGVFWGPDGTSDTAHMGSVRCVYDPPGEIVE